MPDAPTYKKSIFVCPMNGVSYAQPKDAYKAALAVCAFLLQEIQAACKIQEEIRALHSLFFLRYQEYFNKQSHFDFFVVKEKM